MALTEAPSRAARHGLA